MSTKKSLFQDKDIVKNTPIDLLSVFIRDPSKLREQLEKILNNLCIKFLIPSFSAGCIVFKCEKTGVKFDLLLNTSTQIGVLLQSKKKQGNPFSFREIVNLVVKRLNEISDS